MREFTWVLNPHGKQVEVDKQRLSELIKKGYRQLRPEELLVNKRRVKIDAVSVKEEYPWSGYGRVQQLLDENIEWNPQSNNFLHFGYPHEIEREPGKKNILITAFEANRIPPHWPGLLEKYDLILVPSGFCVRIFKDSKTNALIKQMIQGAENFNPITSYSKDEFRFIHYNSFSDNGRKGWDLVIRAFTELFPRGTKGVKLILKGRVHDNSADLLKVPKGYNIEVIIKDMQRYELDNLLSTVHCMVFPSRGEGIGLTPLETMARGIPTIYTNAYGMTEYNEFGIRVDVNDFTPALYGFPFNGNWVEPDLESLKEKMFNVYQHYEMHKKEALGQVSELERLFGLKPMISRFRQLMNKYVNHPANNVPAL